MKELTKLYGDLLQDRRVRSEQLRYESYTRQRNFVLSKYKKIFQAFNDLISGFKRAQRFYSGMKDTVDSLEKNVETFVNNRRSEGAKLLSHIERENAMNASGQADRERDRLRGLMERVSFGQTSSSPPTFSSHSVEVPRPSHVNHAFSSKPTPSPTNFPQPSDSNLQPPLLHATGAAYNHPPSPEDHRQNRNQSLPSQESSSAGAIHSVNDSYNPVEYTSQSTNSLPPQGEFSSRFSQLGSPQYSQNGQFLPQGYIPPPPPPGPPPNLHSGFRTAIHQYSSGPDTYNQYQTSLHGSGSSQNTQNDLWAGLSAWK